LVLDAFSSALHQLFTMTSIKTENTQNQASAAE